MEEALDVSQYLIGEGLLESVAIGGSPALTHKGIREFEQALTKPGKGTEHFQPSVLINVTGDMNVGNVGNISGSQQNVVGSSNIAAKQINYPEMSIDDYSRLVKEIRAIQNKPNLPEEDSQLLDAELSTIEAQIKSPKPKVE